MSKSRRNSRRRSKRTAHENPKNDQSPTPEQTASPVPANSTSDRDLAYSQTEYDIYRDERKTLWDAENQAAKSFGQWMITVAGGALALSMTMVKEVISPRTPITASWLLVCSWVLFAATVACTLSGMLVSQRGFEKYRDDLDKAFGNTAPDPLPRAIELQGKRREGIWIQWLNRASIGLFFVGLLALCIFAWYNLGPKEKPKEKTNGLVSQPAQQQRGDLDAKQRSTTQGANFSPSYMLPASQPANTTAASGG